MSELTVFLIVVACVLVANIISIIAATQVYPEDFNAKNGWKTVWYYVYFIFFGVVYWLKVGLGKLIELIINACKKNKE